MPPTGKHGVVLSEIPRVIHQCDRHSRRLHQLPADFSRAVTTPVIYQDDFMPPLYHQIFNFIHQRGDARLAVVERDDET